MTLCIGKTRFKASLVTASLVVSVALAGCASTASPSQRMTAEDKAVDLVMGSMTKNEAVDCSLTMSALGKLQEGRVISSNVDGSYFSKSSRAFVTRMTNAVDKDEGLAGLLGLMSEEAEFLQTPYVTALQAETHLPTKTAMLKSKFASCEPFSSEYLGEDDVNIDWSVAEAAR